MLRVDELEIAIDYCKKYLIDTSTSDEQKKQDVMAMLVDLKLEMEQHKESITTGKEPEKCTKFKGHEFAIQSASGRNPYCETCLSTIWRIAQRWRRCRVCGFRVHEKCMEKTKRPCAGLKVNQPGFSLNYKICPEVSLVEQNFQCAECQAPIGFDEGLEFEARLCDYTGRFYCKKCHWNDVMYIPARIVRNWDAEKRLVCRAAKQLLVIVDKKPIINISVENPALLRYVNAMNKMHKLRRCIMLMKCYFICCKRARKLRILQYLNKYQHFVESSEMYTLNDLVQLATGTLLKDIEVIVGIFKCHITVECEICMGNAFICELCTVKEVLYPFSDGVSICRDCCAVFHQPCFDRVSKRCSRCARRRARRCFTFDENEENDSKNKMI
uniref:Phorbol-ester/DAG-type domain-containing protein n=1 Tax=Acrobeloides nanus TaxID=290746 RepID=A0A914D1Z5_9BILA